MSLATQPLEAVERLDAMLKGSDVAELEDAILENIIRRDLEYKLNPDYLTTLQREIQWHMRLLLVDWMMEVCDEFGLKRDTFHLATYYVDLYLTKIYCKVDDLQLLGASSLLLACKIEEILCPRVKDFVFATDNGFTE